MRLFLITLFLLVSCFTRPGGPTAPALIALVNGNAIREDDLRFRLNLETSKHDLETMNGQYQELKKNVLTRMIDNHVIVDWGQKQGFTLTPEEQATGQEKLKSDYSNQEFKTMLDEKGIHFVKWHDLAVETLTVEKIIREVLFPKIRVNDAEIMAYYEAHAAEFKHPEQVRVRHLVTDSQEKAQKIRKLIGDGKNFAKMAILYSQSPDRAQGGDLGYFSKGTHPKEFDEVCFHLESGEVSPVIKSPYGYHLFKLIKKRASGSLPLQEVKSKIRAKILKEKLAKAYAPWLDDLHLKAQITIFDENLSRVDPL